MAIQARCASCGSMYDNSYKFCPECSEPNPRHPQYQQNTRRVNTENEDLQTEENSVRNKFKKVGESNLGKSENKAEKPPSSQARQNIKPDKSPIPEPDYEDDYNDDNNETSTYEGDYEDADYEDEDQYPDYGEEDNEEESSEDYENEDYEAEERKIKSFRSKSKALGSPGAKRINQTPKVPKKKVAPKKISSTTRSSLGKKKSYDPNHDGYYDDRLPAILDEVTKTSHIDVILKIALSIVVIAALITYCIFYVNV